jgi:hypothetical protein
MGARIRKFTFVAIAGALTLGALVQLPFRRPNEAPALAQVEGRLARMLPGSFDGWAAKDEALGENEIVRASVEDVLRFDDYVFRRYASGGQWFSVYVAHWRPGKMPTRLVAEHTPDRCWVENGWVCDFRESRRMMTLDGLSLVPGEFRVFHIPGNSSEKYQVMFWLLVDGSSYDYREHSNLLRHAARWWKGAFEGVSPNRPPEHYFIRVVSTTSLEKLGSERGFKQVMESVATLGLSLPVPR